MLATDMIHRWKWHELIGRKIVTQPYGDWPGGVATITEVYPDPEAPEIVLQVKSEEHGEIGVFNFEEVEFAKPT